ncbi:MAG: divalent-cation tolerance protein CutA [Nitrospirae bacterium]|nr:divalent-cation tolerance protein CutA [Nitrospirota bacterium]
MTDYIVVLVTASCEDEASAIAGELVGARLAGCVNIVREIRSIYRWKGKIEDDGEVLMVIKTRKGLFRELMNRVKALHRYSVPEIIALPVLEGSDEYLQWLGEETDRDMP